MLRKGWNMVALRTIENLDISAKAGKTIPMMYIHNGEAINYIIDLAEKSTIDRYDT